MIGVQLAQQITLDPDVSVTDASDLVEAVTDALMDLGIEDVAVSLEFDQRRLAVEVFTIHEGRTIEQIVEWGQNHINQALFVAGLMVPADRPMGGPRPAVLARGELTADLVDA